MKSLLVAPLVACLVLGCATPEGPGSPSTSSASPDNDWRTRIELKEETKIRVDGVDFVLRRHVVAPGGPNLTCKESRGNRVVVGEIWRCGVGRAFVNGDFVPWDPEPDFFFAELLDSRGRVIVPLGPRNVLHVPGIGLLVEDELRALQQSKDIGFWLRGDDKLKIRRSYYHYRHLNVVSGQLEPSDIVVVQPRTIWVDNKPSKAFDVVRQDKASRALTLEFYDASGIPISRYPNFLPVETTLRNRTVAGDCNMPVTGKAPECYWLVNSGTSSQSRQFLLDNSLTPIASPAQDILIVPQRPRNLVLVPIEGSPFYWPLLANLPAGVAGVMPLDHNGHPLRSQELANHHLTGYIVRYTNGDWGVASYWLNTFGTKRWADLALMPGAPHPTSSNATATLAVYNVRDGNQWITYRYNSIVGEDEVKNSTLGKALAAPGSTAEEAYKNFLAVIAREREQKLASDRIANERNAALAAANARAEQQANDRLWTHYVITHGDTRRIDELVHKVSDPNRWIIYATRSPNRSPEVIERAAAAEADPARRAQLLAYAKGIRDQRTQFAEQARQAEATRIQTTRPSAYGGQSGAPAIDRSNPYEAMNRENAARASRGERPWGRTCWGSNCR